MALLFRRRIPLKIRMYNVKVIIINMNLIWIFSLCPVVGDLHLVRMRTYSKTDAFHNGYNYYDEKKNPHKMFVSTQLLNESS